MEDSAFPGALSAPASSLQFSRRRSSAGVLLLAASCLLPLVVQPAVAAPVGLTVPSIAPSIEFSSPQPPTFNIPLYPRAVASSASSKITTSSTKVSTSSTKPTATSTTVATSTKAAVTTSSATPTGDTSGSIPTGITNATANDIFRYRFQWGGNVGSVWVLERWLFPSMFPSNLTANLTSELESVKAWVGQIGIDAARAKFESHWATSVTDDELNWIVNTGHASSLRVPVGFFTLGPAYVKGTPFESVGALYQNAWPAVKQLVARCAAKGIGILLDFHALPGGANTGDHSGTNSGDAALWGNSAYLALAQSGLDFIVKEAKTMTGVTGVQLVNEAMYNAPGMYSFYDSVISSFSPIDNTVPIYISDGWDLPTAIKYVKGKNTVSSTTNPIVIDTHLYWAFDDDDKKKSPSQIMADVPNMLKELDGNDGNVVNGGAVSVVVGEFSNVMDDSSWALAPSGTNRDAVEKQFGLAQSSRYQSRASGAYFWSAAMDTATHGGAWCFADQTDEGNIAPPSYMTMAAANIQTLTQKALSGANAAMTQSYNAHVNYWNSAMPNTQFEHYRYLSGWKVGFNDALTFFNARSAGTVGSNVPGADRIGLLDLWVRKRVKDSGISSSFLWEFEDGLRKGVADFGSLTGAY